MRHSINRLREIFSYNPVEGILTRLKAPRSDAIGVVSLRTNHLSCENVHYTISRLVWALHYGYWPDQLIDHRDGDKGNIKIKNLRAATFQQNMYNRVGYGDYPKGVVLKRDANRAKPWSARIRIDGRKVAIGAYATMEEAAEAYRQAAEKYQGEFALHKSMEL